MSLEQSPKLSHNSLSDKAENTAAREESTVPSYFTDNLEKEQANNCR